MKCSQLPSLVNTSFNSQFIKKRNKLHTYRYKYFIDLIKYITNILLFQEQKKNFTVPRT